MPDLGSAFPALTSSWFRLETLQAYAVDEEREELDAFLRTGRLESPGDEEWQVPVPAGEWPDGLPPLGTDYWLIDDGTPGEGAWSMEYDDDGRWLGAPYVEDPETIEDFRRWRDTALELSVPLDDYLRRGA